jgi:hypothetical protein
MAKKVKHHDKGKKPNQIKVQQIFSIPQGAEDEFAVVGDDWEVDDGYGVETQSGDFDVIDLGEGAYDSTFDEVQAILLDTPTAFTVIDQRLRRSPGGNFVIDVVIQVEDIDGATNYEMQITKAN